MLKPIPTTFFPSIIPWISQNSIATAGSAIDASGEKFAWIFRVPKTGTIDRIRFTTSNVSSSQDLSVSLQTVSATDGFPTGSAYGGSSTETVAGPASSTIYTVTFATPASATKGDMVAVVIEFVSTVGNVQILGGTTGFTSSNAVYGALYTTSWAKTSNALLTVLYDDDTTEFVGCPPAIASGPSRSFNNGSTPDENGLRMKMPFGGRAVGIHGWVQQTAARDTSYILYSDAGTALATIAPDFDMSGSRLGWFTYLFDSPVTLTKDTWYRLMYRPDTANSITIPFFTFTDNYELGQWFGQDIYHCERTNAGAFTDATNKFTPISLMIDAIDIPGVYSVSE